MSEAPEKEFEVEFRLLALETIFVDFMARLHMNDADPLSSAKAHRNRIADISAANPFPEEPGVPGFAEYTSGVAGDFMDKLMGRIEATVKARVHALK